ncbi:L1 [Castor canadensis papillomavirus 1]|uniref:Major capsid protein L1 n=2 Tax=Papillomaviridae TaxID=151340 RepID=V9P7V6_9PAPI|nr:L1 [Castor canadensis papillomavirus 1]AGV05018.1 L1 [Castor canadensis papillomavirus 1]
MIVLQMAVWLPAQNKFYLPPQPVSKIFNTDTYVTRTNIFYHASTDRLLTVGHPFYEVTKSVAGENTVTVPKVSPNQYRVFRVRFPDPNRFAFGDKNIFDPEKERLVWACRGLEISRGQPLGVSITGHPLFNRFDDVENTGKYNSGHSTGDNRQNIAFDPKQVQMFMVGCIPATGEHWSKAQRCAGAAYEAGDCPPIELTNSVIEDGDMVDIGLGALDFRTLQLNRSDAPLDIVNSVCKYPDYIKMGKDPFGDALFFYARREQLYARHMFSRAGLNDSEAVPSELYLPAKEGQAQKTIATDNYFITPSGSLVSSDAQIFNRAYWLQRAQGQNNGIAWENQLFVTVADNTRGTIMSINTPQQQNGSPTDYDAGSFKEYLRHTEEFELQFIMQLCKVTLTPEHLSYVHAFNPDVIESWQLLVGNLPSSSIEDQYRYINSLATKCPDAIVSSERKDPFANYKFWDVDLTDKMSDQLDQYALGRKFLFQSGLRQTDTRAAKVKAMRTGSSTSRPAKRRKRL